jgi:DNA repair exonuclease SbcCD nuclease subunit
MKVAIMSDFHLGLGVKEREQESYANAAKALELALSKNPDVILLAGDLFDSSLPSQEGLCESLKLFSLALEPERKEKATVVDREGNTKKFNFRGVPVIAIHGTHEYRGAGRKTALDILQEAGLLLRLHGESAVVEAGGERLCVYGMGGVPEKKAIDVLRYLNPEPEKDGFSIFMMHQSIKEYLPFEDEMVATISLSDFPQGFDLTVNGHLHWNTFEKVNNNLFLMPGSTIITQMKRIEGERRKGIYLLDTESREARFLELPEQRRLFYSTIDLKEAMPDDVKDALRKEIEKALSASAKGLKPLIRVRLRGSLARGVSSSDLDTAMVEGEFSEKAFLSVSRDFEVAQFRKKISELRKLREKNRSVRELAFSILEKNLDETSFRKAFDHERMLSLLSEGKNEEAVDILAGG